MQMHSKIFICFQSTICLCFFLQLLLKHLICITSSLQRWKELLCVLVKRMAQFTTQGRLKLLFNGEGVSFRLDQKDPFYYKLGSIRTHKRRLRYIGSTTRLHSSLSSWNNKSTRYNAEARLNVGDEAISDDNESDYDEEFQKDELACFRGLVLDIAYRPVNVVGWRRAICLEFMEKVDVLEYYDQTVNSPSGSFYIPAVLRVPHLLQVIKRRTVKNNLSRKNILYRDNYTCIVLHSENLTIDHVVPIARGGEWKWENLVTACTKCNSKKGQMTQQEANMKLLKIPKAPKNYDILAIPLTSAALQMLTARKGTPEEWRQYLSNSS
ncbi:HNH endonuclease [Quillaja saponaria]|uniref:HNH endonuclease n=1 Tax=Quillaja saponaria TaxID=32244 RepID=A0AAD7Q7P9_QUISA|nr:HNH endonuclease [Quillaja saponaria]